MSEGNECGMASPTPLVLHYTEFLSACSCCGWLCCIKKCITNEIPSHTTFTAFIFPVCSLPICKFLNFKVMTYKCPRATCYPDCRKNVGLYDFASLVKQSFLKFCNCPSSSYSTKLYPRHRQKLPILLALIKIKPLPSTGFCKL